MNWLYSKAVKYQVEFKSVRISKNKPNIYTLATGGQPNNFAMNNGFNLDSNSTQAFQGANFFNKSAFETPIPTKNVRKFNF